MVQRQARRHGVHLRAPDAQALGLGHAVLCGRRGRRPFAVLLADDLMVGRSPSAQMTEQFAGGTSIIAVQEVAGRAHAPLRHRGGTPVNDRMPRHDAHRREARAGSAPSRLGVAGRCILTPGVFHEILNQLRGVGGEIQLTDGIVAAAPREGVRLPLRGPALRLRQQGEGF